MACSRNESFDWFFTDILDDIMLFSFSMSIGSEEISGSSSYTVLSDKAASESALIEAFEFRPRK